MAFQLHTFPDDATLARQAASRWLGELRTRNAASGKAYCVALSGGRITRNFFSEITKQAAQDRALFEGVHFFWADERCVPPTDPESNYALAKELFVDPLKIPQAQ